MYVNLWKQGMLDLILQKCYFTRKQVVNNILLYCLHCQLAIRVLKPHWAKINDTIRGCSSVFVSEWKQNNKQLVCGDMT